MPGSAREVQEQVKVIGMDTVTIVDTSDWPNKPIMLLGFSDIAYVWFIKFPCFTC